MASPTQGVTAENFAKKAAAFMRLNECGFVIARQEFQHGAKTHLATPGEWYDWLAYFDRIEYRTRNMRARGYGTVPTRRPFEFDVAAA